MPSLKPTVQPEIPQLVPTGSLQHLDPQDIKPNPNNPRMLFDPDQLAELKKNIAEHGVLVPITVYQPKGQRQFSILDGERRFRCVRDLNSDWHRIKNVIPLRLPANFVQPPNKNASML